MGPVAQWSEQGTHNPLVVGSIPTGPTQIKTKEKQWNTHTPHIANGIRAGTN